MNRKITRTKQLSFAFLTVLSLFFSQVSFGQKPLQYSILDFGAVANTTTVNTKAINAAIQKCHDDGGGTVIVPAGTFITGTVVLLSDINLHLEPGAVLSGSKDTADYLSLNSPLFHEGYSHFGMVYAKNARNISITGQGAINGNGTSFMHDISTLNTKFRLDRNATRQGADYMKDGSFSEDGPLSYEFRPGMLLTFDHCENIHLTDINLQDSPEWTMRIGDCDNVAIRGITIANNPLIPNNDGINCTSTTNIRISDCNIFTGDDAIAISAYTPSGLVKEGYGNHTGTCVNVVVTNCILSSKSSCIRIGSEQYAARNMVFNNIVMYASNRGIGIFSRNNSDIQDITFSNIIINTQIYTGNWWGKGEPIHISAVKESSTDNNGGSIKNIRFSNITANSQTGILIYGIPESKIENVVFDKVSLRISAGKNTAAYGGNFDLQPVFPTTLAIFKHDIPAIYAQHVQNLQLYDVDLSWGAGILPFFSNGIELHQFQNVTIDRLRGTAAFPTKGLAAINASDGTGLVLGNNGTGTVIRTNVH